jgi:transposase
MNILLRTYLVVLSPDIRGIIPSKTEEGVMRKRIQLRNLTTEEASEVRRLAASRTESVRLVQRAQIIALMLEDPDLTASRAGLRVGYKSDAIGPAWVKRFNAEGVAGLEDRPRSGRKPTHSQETRSALISLALQKPRSLGYPFELWTLERLQEAFKERQGVHLASSTIWTWMDEEGFEWKRQQSWFHEAEKHDPQFVEKRGPLSRPT